MADDLVLPEGWTSEPVYGEEDCTALCMPAPGGYVTVSWRRRAFWGGFGVSHGMQASIRTYTGRGWREAIVKDAVAWLTNLYAKQEKRRGK